MLSDQYVVINNKNKQTAYVPGECPPTEEIMAELRDLERKIDEEMDEAERLLKI